MFLLDYASSSDTDTDNSASSWSTAEYGDFNFSQVLISSLSKFLGLQSNGIRPNSQALQVVDGCFGCG